MNSTIGLKPYIAAPTAIPVKPKEEEEKKHNK